MNYRAWISTGVLSLAASWANAVPMLETAGSFGTSHYEVWAEDGISWDDANTFALGMGGYLATLTSAPEDMFVDTLRLASGSASFGFPNSELWIGATRIAGSTDPAAGWNWGNGEGAFGYTNWLPNEPNSVGGVGMEPHAAIGLLGNFGWNDEGNLTGIYGFVVEYDNVAAVPEPLSLGLLTAGFAGLALRRRRQS